MQNYSMQTQILAADGSHSIPALITLFKKKGSLESTSPSRMECLFAVESSHFFVGVNTSLFFRFSEFRWSLLRH